MLVKFLRSTHWLLAITLLVATSATFYFSLNHPITADLAMLHYSAWLINEKHFVLSRDIFDINLPGPYLFHSILGKVIGYDALPLRWVDFVLMSILGWASWKIVSPLSKPAAIFGFSLFCLLYWINGGEFVLERDVLALVPAAVAFALACDNQISNRRIIIIGIFAAMACSMKPNAVVVVPALLWMLYCNSTYKKHISIALLLLAISFVALIPFLWVVANGGLGSFFDIYHQYLPIYANSRYDLYHYESSSERWMTLLTQYAQFSGISLLLAAPGLTWAWLLHRQNTVACKRIIQIAAVTFSFTLYEAIAGKFWLNHLFPSAYWSFLSFSLLLVAPDKTAIATKKIFAIFLMIPCLSLGWLVSDKTLTGMKLSHDKEQIEPLSWRARQVATYLQSHSLQKTDTVQVLDMAGDGQAALLMAKATSATRFLIDVPLWMQPDSQETQTLRQDFLQNLQQKNPAYIVYFEQFLHPGGGNRLKEFRALFEWINNHYEIADQRDAAYTIYRRKNIGQ